MKHDYLNYFSALLLFGMNGIVASRIGLSSVQIVFWRTLIGSVTLMLLFLLSRQRVTAFRHPRDFLFLCLSGAAMGASWMLLYEAYTQIGVGIASLLYYCGPVIVMALSPLLFGEAITWRRSVGFGTVFFGVFLINGNLWSDSGNVSGVLCALASAGLYALMVIANKKAVQIRGMENTLFQLTIAFVVVGTFLLLRGDGPPIPAARDWVWVLLLGVVNTGLGCFFYFSSIGRLPVQTIAICGYLEPLSAVLFSAVLLREKMLPLQIAGAAMIFAGAIFGECTSKHASKHLS